ncbi:MAG: hypothetical protein ACRDKX_01565 [Solirubrobacterales bacterium]
MPSRKVAFSSAILAIAAVSLLLPFALAYDPWAWLVWGREIAHLELDTDAGPSWKPLPVLVAVPLSLFGDAPPDLWLFVARAGWLAAVALAWRVAALLAPGTAAGPLAALGVVLLFDPFTSWTRQFAVGLAEPLLVALVLGALERHVTGARAQALVLMLAAALVRPEAWPFLAAYGAWLWRSEPRLRPWVAGAAMAVPVLWLVPDLIGSGDPLTGARRAREGTGSALGEGIEAIGRALEMPLAAFWPAAGWAALSARGNAAPAIRALAFGAVAWIAIVAVLAAAGYAGLPRFAAPAAAIVCVLGAVGVCVLVRERRLPQLVAAGALALALAIQGGFRAADIPGELDAAAASGDDVEELFRTVDAAGRERLEGCGAVTTSDFLTQPALAWRIERPLDRVAIRIRSSPESGSMLLDSDASASARNAVLRAGTLVASRGRWAAYAISCATSESSANDLAIAGVAGARR